MESLLNQLFGGASTTDSVDSAVTVALNLLLAMFVGVVIAQVYKYVHKGVSYSQSYSYSIVIVTMVVALAMMVIGSDITRAFALLGTFTIIRYRTAVKDPKDTAFIFASLVLGLAVGSSNYGITIAGTTVIALAALVLDHLNFGALRKLDYVLYISVDARKVDQAQLEKIMSQVFTAADLLNVNYDSETHILQYSYNVHSRKSFDHSKAIQQITSIEGVRTCEILASQNIIEF